MNILFFSTNSPYKSDLTKIKKSIKYGGAEISLRLIAEGLAERGQNIYYLSKIKGNYWVNKKIINRVTVIHLPVFWIPKLKSLNSWFYQKELEKMLVYYLSKYHIDLFFTYSIFPDTYLAAKIGKKYRIPVVQRIAGRYWNILLTKNKKYYDKISFVFENISCAVFVSHSLKKITEKLIREKILPLPSRCEVLDIGTNLEKFKAYEKRQNTAEIQLAFVSSFRRDSKRQDILLKAMPIILEKHKNVKAVFVGDGSTLNESKKLAEKLRINENVQFLGYMPHSEIPQILSESNILVLATEFEGYPKSIVEGMAAGKPIVASDIPSTREIIKDGETGLIAKNNPGDFALKIIRLIEDKKLNKVIGLKARKFAEVNFDYKKNILAFENLLNEITLNQNV